jgi:hypothetical protein
MKLEASVDALQQIAEQLQEINDKLDTILDIHIPIEEDEDTCDQCGIPVSSAVGGCTNEDCEYRTCKDCV